MGTPPDRRRRELSHVSNWIWAALFLALVGVVVWGWVYDFAH